MRRVISTVPGVIFWVAAGLTAVAGDPGVEDRPAPENGDKDEEDWVVTSIGDVVPRGHALIEAGLAYQDRPPGQEWSLQTPLNLRLGVLPRVETAVEWDGLVLVTFDDEATTRRSPGDLRWRLKFLANEQIGWFPSVAPSVFVKAPTGGERRGEGSGEWDFGWRLDTTTYWIEDVFYTELAIESTLLGREDRSGNFYHQQGVSFLAAYDKLPRATIYGEIAWTSPEGPGQDHSLVLSLGWLYFPYRKLAFNMGVDIGLVRADPDWGFYFDVLWLTPRLW